MFKNEAENDMMQMIKYILKIIKGNGYITPTLQNTQVSKHLKTKQSKCRNKTPKFHLRVKTPDFYLQ